jgi:hypothetical protein
VLINVETVKNDTQHKRVRKRGYEDIPIGFKSTDRNNIEVGKKGNKEEEKGEKNDLSPSKRQDSDCKKGERDEDQDHILYGEYWHGHNKGITRRVIDRENEEFYIL